MTLVCRVGCVAFLSLAAGLVQAQASATMKPTPDAMLAEIVQHQQAGHIQDLEVQNLQLQIRLEQTRLEARASELKAERAQLEVKLKKAVAAPVGATVDWTKRPAVVVWTKAK